MEQILSFLQTNWYWILIGFETIGILTGITALLPIIGAWIGGGVGALLILVEAPERVIWFLVFILALQQIEGQFIYPRVVGNSIGLLFP